MWHAPAPDFWWRWPHCGLLTGNDHPYTFRTEVLPQAQGNHECVSSHCLLKPKDWLIQNQQNTFCRVLKVCLTAQVLRAQSPGSSPSAAQSRGSTCRKSEHRCPPREDFTPLLTRTSVSLLCPCIHVSFLCHQVSPASAPATQELESPVTSLGNQVWIIWAQSRSYTGFTLWIWNIGDQDFLKAVPEQESGLGFSTIKINTFVGISVSYCFLNRSLFSAWK